GKWCRPNYNSAVATFCHNIARGLPVQVNDPERKMELIYIDEVLSLIKAAIDGEAPEPEASGLRPVRGVRTCLLREIPEKLLAFKESRESLIMPSLEEPLDRELYAAYLSYLPTDEFSYELSARSDARGAFAEIIKSRAAGQISFSTSAPGVTRGQHWHHTKNEKFIVVSGEALIRFRKIDETEVIEYSVSGDKPRVVDIPPGYTHSITNTSASEPMIMVIWASEPFDPERPDTYHTEV
ncbi:MAG: capsular polysaccharide biosynthesis protein CapF, partial [Oscillospiraceae bacterium]|nr:capsular polysaccharide biosynthesis protein CapF [Oscillospiraceae bacterium]